MLFELDNMINDSKYVFFPACCFPLLTSYLFKEAKKKEKKKDYKSLSDSFFNVFFSDDNNPEKNLNVVCFINRKKEPKFR